MSDPKRSRGAASSSRWLVSRVGALALALGAGGVAAYPDRFGAYVDDSYSGLVARIDPTHAEARIDSDAPIYAGHALAGPWMGSRTHASSALADPTPVPGAPPNVGWSVRAGAGVEFYDLTITGSGPSVTSPLKLFLDGVLTGTVERRPGAFVEASVGAASSVQVRVDVYGCPHADCAPTQYPSLRVHGVNRGFLGGMWQSVESRSGQGFLWDSTAWNSVPGTDSIHATISTGPIVFPVNQPFSLVLSITTFSQAGAGYPFALENLAFFATSTADFAHTFGLPAGVPLLDLPGGFRFDAPGYGIVNNVCAGAECITAAVPEPAPAVLWIGALAAAALGSGARRGLRRLAS